jgi:hypothetical protein
MSSDHGSAHTLMLMELNPQIVRKRAKLSFIMDCIFKEAMTKSRFIMNFIRVTVAVEGDARFQFV